MCKVVCIERWNGDLVEVNMNIDECVSLVIDNYYVNKEYYEVLDNNIRKIYLNIDNIEECKCVELLNNFRKYMIDNLIGKNDEAPELAMAVNKGSSHAEGVGCHIVCRNYCMDYRDMEMVVIKFVEEYDYSKYIVNNMVYSDKQYFRLPYSKSPHIFGNIYYDNDFYVFDVDKYDVSDFIVSDVSKCMKISIINDMSLTRLKVASLDRFYKKERYCEVFEDMCWMINEMYDRLIGDGGIPKDRSVYEVLDKNIRKIYLDIDAYDDTVPIDVEEILNEFVVFMRKHSIDPINPLFEITYNDGSGHGHENATSYHIICYNYCMDYRDMRNMVSMFKEECKLCKNNGHYELDGGVYSSKQLFKLPYYIGIKKGHHVKESSSNNYHRLLLNGSESESEIKERLKRCIIQDTRKCDELRCNGIRYVEGHGVSRVYPGSDLGSIIAHVVRHGCIDINLINDMNDCIRKRVLDLYYYMANIDRNIKTDTGLDDFLEYIHDVVIKKIEFDGVDINESILEDLQIN